MGEAKFVDTGKGKGGGGLVGNALVIILVDVISEHEHLDVFS